MDRAERTLSVPVWRQIVSMFVRMVVRAVPVARVVVSPGCLAAVGRCAITWR